MDRKKIGEIIEKAILETEKYPWREGIVIPLDTGKELLEFLTIPAGAYYDYGEYGCKACGCQVTTDDEFCPGCGRLIWEEDHYDELLDEEEEGR